MNIPAHGSSDESYAPTISLPLHTSMKKNLSMLYRSLKYWVFKRWVVWVPQI